MEVTYHSKERGPILIAAVTMAVVGVTLVAVTWQGLMRQGQAVHQHMLLTAKAVSQAVEGSLRGRMRMQMHGGRFSMGAKGRPEAEDFLMELAERGEMLFVGVFDREGGRLLKTSPDLKDTPVEIPKDVFDQLDDQGQFARSIKVGSMTAFVYGRPTRAGVARLLYPDKPLFRDPHNSPEVFLLVGLDSTPHMRVFAEYRNNALFQAAYVLAAALLVWGLSLGFLRRRGAAGRARYLERFQSELLDNLPDGLLTVGPDDVIRAANPAAHAILGHVAPLDREPADEGEESGTGGMLRNGLAGVRITDLPLPFDTSCLYIESMQGEEPCWRHCDCIGRHLEILVLPLPGAPDTHDVLGVAGGSGMPGQVRQVLDQTGQPGMDRLVLIRDRTELRRLEERLAESSKLAALGAMAAGVAHEIRNPLSALRGFAQYFAKKLAGQEPGEAYARTMVAEADRLDRVVSDLLFLARPRPVEPVDVDLAALAEDIRPLLGMDLEARGINFHTRLDSDTVYADRDALKQALLNLALNSIEALDSILDWDADTAPEVVLASEREADGVWVSVEDNGPGMPADLVEHAFEPFTTSKTTGTGLGLAIVHKAVRAHGGRADILTRPGQGTRVRLFFPDVLDHGTLETEPAEGLDVRADDEETA